MNYHRIRILQRLIGWHIAIVAMSCVTALFVAGFIQDELFYRDILLDVFPKIDFMGWFADEITQFPRGDFSRWSEHTVRIVLPFSMIGLSAVMACTLWARKSLARWKTLAASLAAIVVLSAVVPDFIWDHAVPMDPISVASSATAVAMAFLAFRWPSVAVALIGSGVCFLIFQWACQDDSTSFVLFVINPYYGLAITSIAAFFNLRLAHKEAGITDFHAAWAELRLSQRGGLKRALASEVVDLGHEIGRLFGLGGKPEVAAPQQTESELRAIVSSSLVNARKRLAMTQSHLAQCAVVGIRTVQRSEATGRISFENLRSICSVLGIPIPVTEASREAIEPPFAWRGIGLPVAKTAAIMVSFGFGSGWMYVSRRSRALHIGAAVVASILSALFGKEALSEVVEPQIALALATILLTAFPICWAAGSILLGVSWRASSPRRSVFLAVPAVVMLLLPLFLAIPLPVYMLQVEQDRLSRTVVALAKEGASAECIAFSLSTPYFSWNSISRNPNEPYEKFLATWPSGNGSLGFDSAATEASIADCKLKTNAALQALRGEH